MFSRRRRLLSRDARVNSETTFCQWQNLLPFRLPNSMKISISTWTVQERWEFFSSEHLESSGVFSGSLLKILVSWFPIFSSVSPHSIFSFWSSSSFWATNPSRFDYVFSVVSVRFWFSPLTLVLVFSFLPSMSLPFLSVLFLLEFCLLFPVHRAYLSLQQRTLVCEKI